MYPNDNQPPVAPPSNYLDQIAPTAPKKSLFDQKPIMIGGIILFLVLASIIVFMISANAGNRTAPIKHLAAKLNNLQIIADEATGTVKSTKMREMNSNLKIYLTNTIREATPALSKYSIDMGKLDESILALEPTDELSETLEDARLNDVYDRTYANEMAYELEKLLSLMAEIYDKFKDDELHTFLDSAYKDLETSKGQFQSFNAS